MSVENLARLLAEDSPDRKAAPYFAIMMLSVNGGVGWVRFATDDGTKNRFATYEAAREHLATISGYNKTGAYLIVAVCARLDLVEHQSYTLVPKSIKDI